MLNKEKAHNEEKLRMLLTRITDAPKSALYSIGFYEETAKKELELYNKNKKNYKFHHLNFFYNNDFLSPHITIPIFIVFLIDNNHKNIINYMIKDKRTIRNFLEINNIVLKNHIKKQNKLNNAFLYFYSDKKIKENLKTKYPEEYKLIEDKIKLYETIKTF